MCLKYTSGRGTKGSQSISIVVVIMILKVYIFHYLHIVSKWRTLLCIAELLLFVVVFVTEDGSLILRLARDLLEELADELEEIVLVNLINFRFGIVSAIGAAIPSSPQFLLLSSLRIYLKPEIIVTHVVFPLAVSLYFFVVLLYSVDDFCSNVHVLKVKLNPHTSDTFTSNFWFLHNVVILNVLAISPLSPTAESNCGLLQRVALTS